MEFTKIEVALIEKASLDMDRVQQELLNELQLALVGGGSGDVFVG
jgi:hypothetical protein